MCAITFPLLIFHMHIQNFLFAFGKNLTVGCFSTPFQRYYLYQGILYYLLFTILGQNMSVFLFSHLHPYGALNVSFPTFSQTLCFKN